MPHTIIFDTDPGVDDATALLFLANHPEIELAGITTIFGNASIEMTTHNALYLVELFGIDAPVASGEGKAIVRPASDFYPTMVHGENGLGNVAIPETVGRTLDPRPAWQFIVETVKARPSEVTLLAVGRMTNLALALQHAPEIAGLVKEVVIMGGAFSLHGHNGNVSPVAEANIIGDPHAADIVFGADWPVVAIGLDVTRKSVVTNAHLDDLAASGDAKAKFIADISRHYMDYYDRFNAGGFFMHDASAAAYIVAPELFTTRSGPVRVVEDGVAIGQTIQRDPALWYPPGPWDGRPDQKIATDVEAQAVLDLVLGTLVQR